MAGERMTRRRFLVRAGAMAASLGLVGLGAGCGPTPAPTPTAAPKATVAPKAEATPVAKITVPAKKEQVTIRVQADAGPNRDKTYWCATKTEERFSNIKVKVEDIVYGEIAMKTDMLFSTGQLQDVLNAHSRWHWVGSYKGYHVVLDDLLKANPDLVPDYKDQYPALVDIVKFEGKTTGVLEYFTLGGSHVVGWNRELIKAAGAKMPERGMNIWDLQEIALKCASKEKGTFGIELSLSTPHRVAAWLRCWGKPSYGPNGDTSGWLISPDGKKFRWYDNKAAEEFYTKWFRPLLDAKAHPSQADQVEGGLFIAGRLAMASGHEADSGRWVNVTKDKWKFDNNDTMFITGKEGRYGTALAWKVRAVSTQSKYPEEALRVVGVLTSTEAGLQDLLTIGQGHAATKSALTDPRVLQALPVRKLQMDLLSSGSVEGYPIPWNLRDYEFNDVYGNTVNPLLQGVKTWAEQAPVVQTECQKLFDQPRP